MHAYSQPLMSVSVHAASLAQIQKELESFGLNPNDWRAVQTSPLQRARLILVHRDDTDLRLAVDIKSDAAVKTTSTIRSVEMIVL